VKLLFVPADAILGGISANQEVKGITAAKEETLNAPPKKYKY
jgi:hypothetical protein